MMQQQCMQAFKEHPDKPSQARCEELAEAWHDAYTPQAPDRYCLHPLRSAFDQCVSSAERRYVTRHAGTVLRFGVTVEV